MGLGDLGETLTLPVTCRVTLGKNLYQTGPDYLQETEKHPCHVENQCENDNCVFSSSWRRGKGLGWERGQKQKQRQFLMFAFEALGPG